MTDISSYPGYTFKYWSFRKGQFNFIFIHHEWVILRDTLHKKDLYVLDPWFMGKMGFESRMQPLMMLIYFILVIASLLGVCFYIKRKDKCLLIISEVEKYNNTIDLFNKQM